jgi:hypothetical protein
MHETMAVSLRDDLSALAAANDELNDPEAIEDDGTEMVEVGGRGHKRVRNDRRAPPRFIRKWVAWGKAEFPTVWRSRKQADVDCVMRALTRNMRENHVRDRDIQRYKDRICMGICFPSEDEVMVQQMMATRGAGAWQRAADGWKPQNRTWWEWATGADVGPAHFNGA